MKGDSVEAVKGINLIVMFGLELAMLGSFGFWGYQVDPGGWVGWALAVGLPVAGALVWGRWFAPRSARRLTLVPGVLLSLGLFGLAALALVVAGQPVAGAFMAAVAVINRALALFWRQW